MKQVLGMVFSTLLFVGCNSFSFIDSPSGDNQLLSAARGCFDKGDYVCASKYYSQISVASSDKTNSEEAFMLLEQNGMSMSVFMNAVLTASSSGGKLITQLSNSFASVASQSTRLGIFHAYQKTSLIVDRHNQGLIRFITALAFIGELFAETASTPGKLAQTDIVQNPTLCLASKPIFNVGCSAPSGSKLITGQSVSLPTATDTQIAGSPSGSPTLFMVNAAISEIQTAISQMQTNGDLGSSTSSFATAILAANSSLVAGTDSPPYRGILIQFNIGE